MFIGERFLLAPHRGRILCGSRRPETSPQAPTRPSRGVRDIAPGLFGATSRKVQLTGNTLVHISGGKIAARWENTDQFGLLQQPGALPHCLPLTPRQQGAPSFACGS